MPHSSLSSRKKFLIQEGRNEAALRSHTLAEENLRRLRKQGPALEEARLLREKESQMHEFQHAGDFDLERARAKQKKITASGKTKTNVGAGTEKGPSKEIPYNPKGSQRKKKGNR